MKIISWNINGLNSGIKNGLIDFMQSENADIYCFQEVKVSPEKIPVLLSDSNFNYWYLAEKNGYSGLLIHTKIKPLSVIKGIKQEEFDKEARVLTLEFPDFFLVNAYFPHSNRKLERLDFKLKFNQLLESFCENLNLKKPVIIASDFNVAHTEIDLRNPKQNEKNAGFTIEERNWFDSFLQKGYLDTFREFIQDGGNYTWWTYRNNARERNIGWRIDYFVVSERMKSKIKNSSILKDVYGSDHCPICLEMDL